MKSEGDIDLKVVILAGGLPSIISDENDKIPKPMVQIGERPILWHIMKLYSYYGFHDFLICTGYCGEMVKRYFMDYYIYRSDITVDLASNDITIHNNITEPWNVTIVHTGFETTTAKRVEKILSYIEEEDFIVSYGDCISNINIKELVENHKQSGKALTATVARPTGRNAILPVNVKGEMEADDAVVGEMNAWVNACNMVVNKSLFKKTIIQQFDRFEIETLQAMIQQDEVKIYCHNDFWLPVETMRDKLLLQSMWDCGNIPWKVWAD